MRKTVSVVLALVMVLSLLTACGKQPVGNVADPSEPFEWTREGYFTDEDSNMMYVFKSEEKDHPGWVVGCVIGETIHGWYIQQEGNTLHGDLAGDFSDGEFVVTVSEEGKDGLMLAVEGGNTYHFTPYDMPEANIFVNINTEGLGQIAYAEYNENEEAQINFSEDYPAQSAQINLEEPAKYILGAKPDDGWKFLRWTKNGETISTEEQINVELAESAEYVAVFGIAGSDETYVELLEVKTLGELLGLPNYGTSFNEEYFIYAFEQDGIIYRAVAEITPEISEALFALDFDDPEYAAKVKELVSQQKILRIDNLSETAPSQDELNALVGKTGKELFENGWTNSGWNLNDMVFQMNHGPYSFSIVFEGNVENKDDFDEEDINELVVKSVEYVGVGDPTFFEEPEK